VEENGGATICRAKTDQRVLARGSLPVTHGADAIERRRRSRCPDRIKGKIVAIGAILTAGLVQSGCVRKMVYPGATAADYAECRMEGRRQPCNTKQGGALAEEITCSNNMTMQFQDCMAAKGFVGYPDGDVPPSSPRLAKRAKPAKTSVSSTTPQQGFWTRRPRPAVTPRGFYCGASTCAREKAACEQFRIAAGDPNACKLVESAFCFAIGDVGACSPTLDLCRRQWAIAGDSAESECVAPDGASTSQLR
jgi:hypothetical protein